MNSETIKIFQRVYAAAKLVSEFMNWQCMIISPNSSIIAQFPDTWLPNCFCRRLERITGKKIPLDHFHERFNRLDNSSAHVIYTCPFGLTNIVIPAFRQGERNGILTTLQIGPILTSDPLTILNKHSLSTADIDISALRAMEAYLKALPTCDVAHLLIHADAINTLINSPLFTFGYKAELFAQRQLAEKTAQMDPPISTSHDTTLASESEKTISDIACAAQGFIRSHFTDSEISLNDVAKSLYVHPSYLSRIFAEQLGWHFPNYVNFLRIKLATKLLTETDKPIGTICREVGFVDHSYFVKVFKEFLGMTPSKYRKVFRDQTCEPLSPSDQ